MKACRLGVLGGIATVICATSVARASHLPNLSVGLVKDIFPGNHPTSGAPNGGLANAGAAGSMVDFGGVLYFVGNGGTGAELWRSDGTADGTYLVKEIDPSVNPDNGFQFSGSPSLLTVVDGNLYFRATDGTTSGHGTELWRSDGTEAGTRRVSDINTAGNSAQLHIVGLNGKVLFSATDGSSGTLGRELYAYDPQLDSVELVKNINTVSGNGLDTTNSFAVMDGYVYFRGNDGVNGRELWRTDGTEANTTMVTDITTNDDIHSNPTAFTTVGNLVFFQADQDEFGRELHATDGTTTWQVANLADGSSLGSTPFITHVPALNKVFFIADDLSATGAELYVTDDTSPNELNTIRLTDIDPGEADSLSRPLIAFNDQLYFAGESGGTYDLWTSDGTVDGTEAVLDVLDSFGNESTGLSNFVTYSDYLFFVAAFRRDHDNDDGTPLQTFYELWASDGTALGTHSIFTDGIGNGFVRNLLVVGDKLFFTANAGEGEELYVLTIPEPGALALMAAGSGFILWRSRRRAA